MAKGDKWTLTKSVTVFSTHDNNKAVQQKIVGTLSINGLNIFGGTSLNNTMTTSKTVTELDSKMTNTGLWIQISESGLNGWILTSGMTCTPVPSSTTTEPEEDEPFVPGVVPGTTPSNPSGGNATTEEAIDYERELELNGSGYQPSVDELFKSINSKISDSDFANIKHIMGVFGLPYQFLPNTDLRLIDSQSDSVRNLGSEYAEKIIEKMPLLFLAPGKASFMTKYSKENKKSVLEKLITVDHNRNSITESSLEDILNNDGRYYTFEYDAVRYYKFVNPMCRIASRFLEVDDVMINGTRLDMMNWEQFTQSGISSLGSFGSFSSVPFYVEAETSINESLGNNTTQSMIQSATSSISDMGRELSFLLGTASTQSKLVELDADMANNIENLQDMVNSLLGSGNFISNIGNHLSAVAAGGKLQFPEIWSDSSFNRSYSCELKFISPDASNLSVYLNVIVPLMHLLALVAPHTIENNPNGYTNPFLVRAIYKGFFNIDTGIITGMSISKGAECQWTPSGIPTSVTVSIDIKDLYQTMAITSTQSTSDWKFDTLNNTALMDYIANLCGVNIYEPEIGRMIELWYVNNFTNRAADFLELDIWGGVKQKVQNMIMNVYR